ncbi:MAG: D-alanyl-D-alanine carboxypeptidase [Desulfitobacterium hafniense]|nr:D-alanyl-D-alanine carboxypeptidase [Desulfitobacterium hafniense]
MIRKKWVLACFSVLLFFLSSNTPAKAIETEHVPAAKKMQTNKRNSTGKKVSSKQKPVSPNTSVSNLPSLTADTAVLLDVATGDVLFDKQAYKRRPPASTTKIMTAILGLELGRPEEIVTVSPRAAAVGESTIHLDPGEKITLYELITGALVKSGNDACVAIAEQIAGSEERFIKLMNQKAWALGVRDTNFVNTNGLPNKNHYSTAYDLAVIARYGLQLPTFASIIRQKETEIHFLEPDVLMDLRNTNKLLWSYPFADGVKTGTTNAAGKCLVASATKDGRQLVCVVLHAPNRFGDAQKLLEWGFNNTETVMLGKAGQVMSEFPLANSNPVRAFLEYPAEVAINKSEKDKLKSQIVWERGLTLPIRPGEKLGYFEIWLDEKRLLRSIPLLSEQEVRTNRPIKGLFPKFAPLP